MSASPATTLAAASGSAPYVGLRPFGPEEHDWFYGRDADAQFLVDKVLSARLTLLYAPSGVGKSSLLRARVISMLETEDCRVLYFDAWAGLDPASALKDKLAEMARSAGVTDPLAGAPTIAELVQLSASDGRTLVLVLDQFEEFLTNHAQQLDPLRKEIAALVRAPSVDARVVISLREEFLAAIEPFRQEILTLFQSTYRLESLPAEEARKAVIKPAARFGGEVEPALADRLVAALSESPSDSAMGPAAARDIGPAFVWRTWISRVVTRLRGRAPVSETPVMSGEPESSQGVSSVTIDLPMLQLVCEHMWRAARVVDGRRTLTLDFYERLGGRRKILGDHIRSRMPQRWRDRLFTATLMRFLAPPSGLKISYSAADLAEYSHLDQERVEAELMRLSGADARILRRREFKESVRFELQHDALIRHITPWRDAVLAEAAAVRRLKLIGGAVAVVVAVVVSVRLYHRVEVRDNTDVRMNALRDMSSPERRQRAANTFETVASYLLFQERGTERLDHLQALLVNNRDLLPEGYATGTVDLDVPAPSTADDSALAMRFSSDWMLDAPSFSRAWSEVAQRIGGRWGIPVPTRVRLISDPDFPRTSIQFELSGQTLRSMDLEAPEGMALVSMEGAPESAREFHRRFEKEWRHLEGLESDTWWAVPRWSLPVWRAAGLSVWGGSAYPALAMNAALEKDPTILLTTASTEFLVQRVAQQYPCTAAEVWAARGALLRQDLISWVKASEGPRALLHPHLVFDALADLGRASSETQRVGMSTGYLDTLKQGPNTAWPQVSGSKPPCEPPKIGSDAFRGVEEWLPPLKPKVRVALGAELVRAWTDERQTIATAPASTQTGQSEKPAASRTVDQRRRIGSSPELTEALEHYREAVYRRSGIWLPDVTFGDASLELSDTQARHFRVALLDAQDQEAPSIDARSTGQEGIDRLIAALDEAASPATLAWIDAESVKRLMTGDERTRKAVEKQNLSATDLKLLLRAVISRAGPDATTESSPPAGSVRDSDWLISSLVFWKPFYEDEHAPALEGPTLLPDLAARLRRLQARRDAKAGATRPGAASALVRRGIDALEAGRVDDSEKLFQEALRTAPRPEIETIFVDEYAARWQASRRARTAAACRKPTEATLDPGARIDVETLLDEPESRRDRTTSRNLALCVLSSMPSTVPKAKAALRLKIAEQYGAPEDWPAEQARWLGLQLLEQYDPSRDPSAVKDQGLRFMTAAVRRLPSNQDAATAFNDLTGICLKPGPKNWCWPLLATVAEVRPYPWTALDLANALSDREMNADAEKALSWVERARSLYASDRTATNVERQRFNFWVAHVRANALLVLGMNGDVQRFEEARRIIPTLIESPATETDSTLKASALLLGIRVLLDGPNPDQATAAMFMDMGLKSSPDEPAFLSTTIFNGLRLGNIPVVERAVRDAYAKASTEVDPENRARLLMISAVGGLIAGNDRTQSELAARQFIRTGHRYAPLVSMLLSAGTRGVAQDDANRLLAQRWARIDSATWDARLRGGDGEAWYEMLVSYFLGKVPAGDIFDPLRDDSALTSSTLAGLPVTRKRLLTEAYFYDALRRMAAGDHAGQMKSLQQVVDLGHKGYIEYDLAVHLLRVGSMPGKALAGAR